MELENSSGQYQVPLVTCSGLLDDRQTSTPRNKENGPEQIGRSHWDDKKEAAQANRKCTSEGCN